MAVGEWDQRQLCPDGGCVGVIGPEGTCKVCGRAALNWGDERTRGLLEPEEDEDEDDEEDELAGDEGYEDEDDEDEDDEDEDELEGDEDDEDELEDDEEEDEAPRAAESAESPAAWTGRELCPDGACIGVIGPDGRCKVCGRSASVAPREAAAGDRDVEHDPEHDPEHDLEPDR